MMILTSFHSADPSTPTGVRCGKCLWVIHRPAIWAHESTCLLENLCAFSTGLACVCRSLWMVASAHLTEFFAMVILTSFHSADPSTPMGVRCGKCLWVIHRPAIWACESTCLLAEFVCVLERFSLRLQVFVNGCSCTFDWVFCHDDPYKFPFGRP